VSISLVKLCYINCILSNRAVHENFRASDKRLTSDDNVSICLNVAANRDGSCESDFELQDLCQKSQNLASRSPFQTLLKVTKGQAENRRTTKKQTNKKEFRINQSCDKPDDLYKQ
jgi:hypothetical protein